MSFVLLIGPTASGKTSIRSRLLALDGFIPFKTNTSREEREEEKVEGFIPQYNFHTREEFKHAIENNEFFEWVEYGKSYYGTKKSDIEQAINNNNNIVLGIVEIEGAQNIKRAYPNVLTIFISPPSLSEIENRSISRSTETEEERKERLETAKKEMAEKDKMDVVVMNEKLDIATNEILAIIQKFHLEKKQQTFL